MSDKKSLPIRVTDVQLRLAGGDSPDSTLATGTVTFNGGLNVRIRVLKSKTGPFAKMPNFRIGEGDEARWFDYAYPTGEMARDIRDHFNTVVVGAYEQKVALLSGELEASPELGADDTPFDTETEK